MYCAPDAARRRQRDAAEAGLPLRDASTAIDDACGSAPAARVLYIEDEPLNALLMTELLRSVPQWTLQVARDGLSGVEAARARRPDLILTDMQLPGLDGYGVLARLREDPLLESVPCLVLSADAHDAHVKRALDAGFDGYLTKPVDLHELVSRIHRHLREIAEAPGDTGSSAGFDDAS